MKTLKNLSSVFLFLLVLLFAGACTEDDNSSGSGGGQSGVITESYLLGTWVYPGDAGDDYFTFKKGGVGEWSFTFEGETILETFTYVYNAKSKELILKYDDGVDVFYIENHTENTITFSYEISDGIIEQSVLYRQGGSTSEETLGEQLIGTWIFTEDHPSDYTYVIFKTEGQGEIRYYDSYGMESEYFTYTVNDSLFTGVTGDYATSTSELTNQLATTSLKVQKVWANDRNNAYDTRPDTDEEGMTWETSFLIQRTTAVDPAEEDWQAVQVTEGVHSLRPAAKGARWRTLFLPRRGAPAGVWLDGGRHGREWEGR